MLPRTTRLWVDVLVLVAELIEYLLVRPLAQLEHYSGISDKVLICFPQDSRVDVLVLVAESIEYLLVRPLAQLDRCGTQRR